jgi:hypothetical protein
MAGDAPNGSDPLDGIIRTLELLLQAQKVNLEEQARNTEEHERIWKAVELLRNLHLELLDVINARIPRMPPESLP